MLPDIPGGNAACRVAIVADADKISDATLTGPGAQGGDKSPPIDRVVGFAGVYPDNNIPLGPVVQVRRDDSYRQMGADFRQDRGDKVIWRCAYYITMATPTAATSPTLVPNKFNGFTSGQKQGLVAEGLGPDEPPPADDTAPADGAVNTDGAATMSDAPLTNGTTADGGAVNGGTATDGATIEEPLQINYDQLMDRNISQDIVIGKSSWGGQMFGFQIGQDVDNESENKPLDTYSDSAVDELKHGLEERTTS